MAARRKCLGPNSRTGGPKSRVPESSGRSEWRRSTMIPPGHPDIGPHPPRTSVSEGAFACFETGVGFFEHASGSLAVGAMLKKGQRVPLAPLGSKEVSAIDVDGTS